MTNIDHTNFDASVSIVQQHNDGRPEAYGIIVPYSQAKRYVKMEKIAKKYPLNLGLDLMLMVLSFTLGFFLASAI